MTATTLHFADSNLSAHKFIYLTTFRKNGTPVGTPVTFAPFDGKLYVVTGVKSGKAQRLRRTERVELAPCDSRGKVLGPTVTGRARLLSSEEAERLKPQLKFRAGNWLMFFFNRLRDLRLGGNIYLEILL